ncbi:MAG: helix-turn-helix domain-containing protein [Actinomycetota bacterium]
MDEFLTPEEAARILSVTPGAIREWIRSGKLCAVKAGKLWRIRESELTLFLKESTDIYGAATEPESAPEPRPREYSRREIQEFMEADRLSPELARKIESILRR